MGTLNLIGQRFSYLTVIARNGSSKRRNALWLCQCDCGNTKIYDTTTLRSGHVVSCGCYARKLSSERITRYSLKHGHRNTRLYWIWNAIKRRTGDPKYGTYRYYGGRGIKLCDEWQDFGPFYQWAMANGYDPDAPYGKCTIDRINNDGNYEPDNCRWVDMKVQSNNRRKAVRSCKKDA